MNNIIYFVLLLFFNHCFAANFYPNKPYFYYTGIDQDHHSCRSAAEIYALTKQFNDFGYSGIKFSLLFHYVTNWQHMEFDEQIMKIEKNSENLNLYDKYGIFVPDYFFPENGLGTKIYDSWNKSLGNLYGFHEMTVLPESFPRWQNTDIVKVNKTFATGFASTYRTNVVQFFKEYLENNHTLVINYNSEIIQEFDHITGLLINSEVSLEKYTVEKVNHASVLVGYDDSLYENQGAFIIRNSWIDNGRRIINQKAKIEDYPDLRIMKYRISEGESLPGYYAVPYSYIENLVKNGDLNKGAFTYFKVNYQKVFEDYIKFHDYKIHTIPFLCESKLNDFKNRYRKREFHQRMLRSQMTQIGNIFGYALLTTSPNKNQVKEFLNGDYDHFYCGESDDKPYKGVSYEKLLEFSETLEGPTGWFTWNNVFKEFYKSMNK